jgi:hypothetical protein
MCRCRRQYAGTMRETNPRLLKTILMTRTISQTESQPLRHSTRCMAARRNRKAAARRNRLALI